MTQQTMNWWPLVSIGVNVVMALILFSLRSALRIAMLELREFISEKYATKEYVDQQVDIASRIESIPRKVYSLIANPNHDKQTTGVVR